MSQESFVDLASVRRRLADGGGRRYWKSLEELASTAGFRSFLEREFPEQASEWNDPNGRREFLRIMGASLALAGLTACTRQPEEKIVPYVKSPEQVVPGRPLFFATSVLDHGFAKGVLVDLAHATAPAVDQALDIAKAPVIWSHGWVDGDGGRWQDRYGHLKRRLSLAHAKKIAARGGVVGLWALGLSRPGPGWSVGAGNTGAYAREIATLADKLGADHVAFGTDIEGVGPNWAVNHYGHARTVVEKLQEMKLGDSVVERVAYGNYARVLKAVLRA